ncbi:MAG: hypothetical protein AB7G62_05690 [Magnetospirillum sp.]
MHLHHNAQHCLSPSDITARPGETRLLPDGGILDVEQAVAAIRAAPEPFHWAEIRLSMLASQIKGQTKLNFHYVASMERERARRPLLLGRQADGELLLLDGRHRAARSLQLGYATAWAWVLNVAQMDGFRCQDGVASPLL